MEEYKSNVLFENEYLFKILYLIRKNLPTSEFIYLLMFFLKYIGLILFSISLNVFDTNSSTNDNNKSYNNGKSARIILTDILIRNAQEMDELDSDNSLTDFRPPLPDNGGDNEVKPNSMNNNNMIQTIFKKFLINGDNFNILNDYYQIICLVGLIILVIYIFLWFMGYFYMKNKYYTKVPTTITDKKIKQINQSTKLEKRFFRFMTYFLFLIIFFHQYILEYYIFGFLGYILDSADAISSSSFMEHSNEVRLRNLEEYFTDLTFPKLFTIITNFIAIILISILFVLFLLINSSKTLYIKVNYSSSK